MWCLAGLFGFRRHLRKFAVGVNWVDKDSKNARISLCNYLAEGHDLSDQEIAIGNESKICVGLV